MILPPHWYYLACSSLHLDVFSGPCASLMPSVPPSGYNTPLAILSGSALAAPATGDACATIGTQKWTSPSEILACFKSFPLDEKIRTNVLDAVEKTLGFHTSVNYQRLAPFPFSLDVHEDILGDIARIRKASYKSEFDMHLDLFRAVKRLNDGHASYFNLCYDSLFTSYVPLPLVLLDDGILGTQAVHIAPEAAKVAAAEFPDQINYWQTAAKVNISDIAGSKVVLIDGLDPWAAVNDNAAITGSYQSFGTRQNSFFSSYSRGAAGWSYILGNFAAKTLPLWDSVKLTIQRPGSSKLETITIPYRARIAATVKPFSSTAAWRSQNCVATSTTNGANVYDSPTAKRSITQKQKRLVSHIMDDAIPQDVVLPPTLTPGSPISDGGVAQFYQLSDNKTGVLALGSFSASSYEGFHQALLDGLQALKAAGSTRLIVDVTNNGGGYICVAHFLHRIIVGPKASTIPQAGLDTETRAGPLAQAIVEKILAGADPENQLLYNPAGWAYPNGTYYNATYNWLAKPRTLSINGHADKFSQRMSDQCQPFVIDPPAEALFDPKQVVIVNNGRCASSCALFSITMIKKEGSKGVVVGGNKLSPQQYTGTVGGQSTDYVTITTEVKTAGLQGDSLAPPDFITNSMQGITWRLGFGVDNPNEPEEWQNHAASLNYGLSAKTVNNPLALWEELKGKVF